MTDNPFTSASSEDDRNQPVRENRDEELAARLDADHVPNHGPTFWSDLQTSLDAEAPTASIRNNGASPRAAEHLASIATEDEAKVVPFDRTSRRRRLPVVFSAAAAALLLAVAAVVLIDRSDDAISVESTDQSELDSVEIDNTDDTVGETDGTENDSVTDDSGEPEESSLEPEITPADAPLVSPEDFNLTAITTIGTGQFVGFTPDQAGLLVLDDVTSGQTGCEGGPLLELLIHDLATGSRTPALPEGTTFETGGLDFLFRFSGGDSGPVTFIEYCDGVPGNGWIGSIAPNGIITEMQAIGVDSAGRPADLPEVITPQALGARALTPDQLAGAFIEEGRLRVSMLVDDQTWNAPTNLIAGDATFDPSGQVVAITTEDGLWLWNYRTDELAKYGYNGGITPNFNLAGDQLVVERFDNTGFWGIDVLSFNDAVVPAAMTTPDQTEATCSGSLSLAPLDTSSLEGAGVPTPVVQTAAAIDQAAASCDWPLLTSLLAADFTASFGGDPAIELWQSQEQSGTGVMDELRRILRQPVGTVGETDPIYSWPAVHTREGGCPAYTEEDLASLADLGYTEETIARDCDFLGGYAGYRVGFDSSGSWLYFVAGD